MKMRGEVPPRHPALGIVAAPAPCEVPEGFGGEDAW